MQPSASPVAENASGKTSERLKVAVRVRPLNASESSSVLHVVNDKTILLEETSDKNDVLRQKRAAIQRTYTYDMVFDESTSTETVYNTTTKPLVVDVTNGYNATVFAYGATGAGKTHTMVGEPDSPGIMVRALDDLFHVINNSDRNVDRYTVNMSCLEIYNENIRDLLNPASGYLELREEKGKSMYVAGLTEISTTSTNEVMQLLLRANRSRTVEPTAVNETSSRSHALVSVKVTRQSTAHESNNPKTSRGKGQTTVGKLFMIDLAGSERANKTKNRGKRLQEGAHINRSLLALGNCINALAGGARYINYRDSKLTRLLKDSFTGNSRTVMIAHVSPFLGQKEETRNTLVYAERANKISTKVMKNYVDVNYHVNQYQSVITELRNEISRLRVKMSEQRPRSGNVDSLSSSQKNKEIRGLREQIVNTFKEQMRLRKTLMEIDAHLLSLGMDAERQHMIISNWESRNNKLYRKNGRGMRTSRTRESRKKQTTSDSNTSGSNDGESSISDGEVEGELAINQAYAEVTAIEREQERWTEERMRVEEELEICRETGAALEDELPMRISTDDERELLALLCRVHELEAEKLTLQGEKIAKIHELKRRDNALLRCERQRQISEAIITRQRQIMEDIKLQLPSDLQELYRAYQQEIHAATAYSDYAGSPDKLPYLTSRGSTESSYFHRRRSPDIDGMYTSSAESDYSASPLPPLNEHVLINAPVEDRLMGQLVPPPSRSVNVVKFPPIRHSTKGKVRGNGRFPTTSVSPIHDED